jgi:ribosomal protein L11 methylase PrmA
MVNILTSLRSWVKGLEPLRNGPPIWEGYASDNSYTAAETGLKRAFVEKFSSTVRPNLLLDIGCNTGEYAKAALKAGARTALGWESDHGALDAAYRKANAENLKFLPLYSDAANTSPAQGWNGHERQSLVDRVRADAVFGLALVHHMAIARNIPLGMAINWIMDRAPNGVIEFVPKTDPMVRQLLKLREDIFADYTEETFLERIRSRGNIVESERLPNSGRLLVWFRRK